MKTTGSSTIREIAIVRDNTFDHKRPGDGERIEFTSNVAWSSPIWVKYR